jgi:hypothetical protein
LPSEASCPLTDVSAASEYLGLSSSTSSRTVKLGATRHKRGPVLPPRTIRDHQAVDDAGRRPLGGRSAKALGFVVCRRHSVYFAGDTDLLDAMSCLGPNLDLALLPVWGWGPTRGVGHLDPRAPPARPRYGHTSPYRSTGGP